MSSDTTLILLPGLDGTGKLFEPFLAAAPRGLAPIPVAYPTQFASYDELEPIVRAKLTDHCVLLAESFSGPLGVRLAADARVRALILCNSFVSPPHPAWLRHLAIGPLFCVPPPGWLLRRFLLGKVATPELCQSVRDAVRQVPRAVLARRLRQVLSCGEQKVLSSHRKPVLYLRGSNDAVVSLLSWRAIKSVNPDAQLAEVAGPHLLLQTEPQACWKAILPFLGAVGVGVN
ncbi:MAG TPA: alpha/beta hydrolase [Pirellulaceae bacterium]|nr:alpha/beta hydrolase [Pirellulaceae bacterium]